MEELREQGWYISANGYNVISQNDSIRSKNVLVTNALNTDIKEFGQAILQQELKQNKVEKIILQIQKIKNISAPKANPNSQAAPRMLKLTLTDGHTNCQAVEISNLNFLSCSNTSPGTKILINRAKVSANCILLQPNCCTLLGGKVPALYEKWELSKNLLEQRTGGMDGPPPWVNFGEKIITNISDEPFKALVSKEAKKDEFDIQRQDAINVATTGAVKKVFGGGTKNVALTEVKKTYEKHYRKRDFEKVEEHQKAPDKISLFNFLEDKLQTNNELGDAPKPVTQYDGGKFQKYNNDGYKPKFISKKPDDKIDDAIVKNFEKLAVSNTNNSKVWNWRIGDLCMAKYWEDSKYYNATVVNLTERTCVVQFNGYGNVEEVLKLDCIPIQYEPPKPKQYKTRNYKDIINIYLLFLCAMEVPNFPVIDPNIDYEKISPILQKRIVVFINHFISNTVSFLNSFAQSCESRLMEFDYKIQKVEASLLILESQLSSIPSLNDSQLSSVQVENSTLELPEVKEEVVEDISVQSCKAADDPRFSKFFKMLQVGVPRQAVKNKMELEGLDPNIIDNPNSIVPGGTIEEP
ncbi:hypothetical protein FQR65_LT02403 [Abscondita terminalis]|nr:hypothetical protein FQR65_LT02403 [Abscondita terminalis]